VNETTTTRDPNAVIAHAAAHGLAAVWPWLVLIGVTVVALMVYVEWKRQGRRRSTSKGTT
jgi:hypothetical protein